MEDLTFVEYLRSVLIISTIAVLVVLGYRVFRSASDKPIQDVIFYIGVLLLLFANAARSWVAMRQGDPFVWPLAFYMAGVMCFIIYLARPKGPNDL